MACGGVQPWVRVLTSVFTFLLSVSLSFLPCHINTAPPPSLVAVASRCILTPAVTSWGRAAGAQGSRRRRSVKWQRDQCWNHMMNAASRWRTGEGQSPGSYCLKNHFIFKSETGTLYLRPRGHFGFQQSTNRVQENNKTHETMHVAEGKCSGGLHVAPTQTQTKTDQSLFWSKSANNSECILCQNDKR